MGDVLRGGETVLAMAVEYSPQGPRYWLTANAHVDEIKVFMTKVLQMLTVQTSSEAERCGALHTPSIRRRAL